MTDDEVAALLRSDAPLVVIEAPAGCGKTHQAASYTADAAAGLSAGKILVLTHTHAACSVIAERTKARQPSVDIRTLDGLIHQIATAYRLPLALPEDVAGWARQNGYEAVAQKVARLLNGNPMICQHLTRHFPVVICDEHQDSNEHQDSVVGLLHTHGAAVRVFGDPMQTIPGGVGQNAVVTATNQRWQSIKQIAVCGDLETPHRWNNTNPQLGIWVQSARRSLMNGNAIDLTQGVPNAVDIMFAENNSQVPNQYQLAPQNWDRLNGCLNQNREMLLIAASNSTVHRLRGSLRRRFPIWEGHTRDQLETLIDVLAADGNTTAQKAQAFITFLQSVLVGFSSARYGNRLLEEIRQPSDNPRGSIPPQLKTMAGFIADDPSHLGFARAADHLRTLVDQETDGFSNLNIYYPRELSDLIRLRSYSDVQQGFADLSQRRSRAHPKPPRKALSTVHN